MIFSKYFFKIILNCKMMKALFFRLKIKQNLEQSPMKMKITYIIQIIIVIILLIHSKILILLMRNTKVKEGKALNNFNNLKINKCSNLKLHWQVVQHYKKNNQWINWVYKMKRNSCMRFTIRIKMMIMMDVSRINCIKITWLLMNSNHNTQLQLNH